VDVRECAGGGNRSLGVNIEHAGNADGLTPRSHLSFFWVKKTDGLSPLALKKKKSPKRRIKIIDQEEDVGSRGVRH